MDDITLEHLLRHVGLLVDEGVEVQLGLLQRCGLGPPRETRHRDGLWNILPIAAAPRNTSRCIRECDNKANERTRFLARCNGSPLLGGLGPPAGFPASFGRAGLPLTCAHKRSG